MRWRLRASVVEQERWRAARASARAGEARGGGVRVGGDAGERRSGWKEGESWRAGPVCQQVKGVRRLGCAGRARRARGLARARVGPR